MILDPVVGGMIYPVCWWLFLSGMDEMFIDFWFAYFTTFGRDSWALSLKQLNEIPEKQVAMFVPCWREFDVIEDMINHNIAAIDYKNYDIFLGVYPNDPRTLEKAVLLEERYPRVHHSICPNDGPTNKADCLNWIYQRMALEEEARGVHYEVIVQHDAEDIIHPKAFKLINRLIGDYDMVQIPVFPLETPLNYFTHGTYCDEFAEFQIKDIYTRQSIGGFVPSAGVGTAFEREALDEIAGLYRNQIYNVNTLTEDYEIGLKFKLHGKRQILVRKAIPLVGRNGNGNGPKNGKGNGNGGNGKTSANAQAQRANGGTATLGLAGNGGAAGNGGDRKAAIGNSRTNAKGNGNGGNGKTNGNGHNGNGHNGNGRRVEFIATREYFPNTFQHAVRQKSRWVMGIALQSWAQMGWRGSFGNAYWYWRDRKGLVGNIVSVLSNLIFVYCLLMWLGAKLFDTAWTFGMVFPATGAIWWLLPCTTFFIFERQVYKVYAVHKIYGARQAVGAVIRTPWANLINFSSTVYALYTFFKSKALHVEPKWAKTSHAFPTREQLLEYKRRLGDLLLENRLISAMQLEEALATQRDTGERLGEVLVRLGYLTELQCAQMIGRQQNIEVREIDPYSIDLAALRKIPKETALEYGVIPVSFVNHAGLLVASDGLMSTGTHQALEQLTGLSIVGLLTTQSDFRFALARAYGRLQFDPSGKVRLGEMLVNAGCLTEEQLQQALRQQKSSHKPLGEVLLMNGWVSEEALRNVFISGGREFRRVRREDVKPEVRRLLPLELQQQMQAVPIERDGEVLIVAIGWPLPEEARRRLEETSRCVVRIVYAPPSDLAELLNPDANE